MILKSVALFILVFLCNFSSAQISDGTYTADYDFIRLDSNYATFTISSNGGLRMYYCGEGPYEIVEDYLIINAGIFHGQKSRVHEIPSLDNEIEISVRDLKGAPLPFINLYFTSAKGKIIGGGISNESGIARIERNPKIKNLQVINLVYDNLIIDYKPNTNYNFELADLHILENNQVIFKIQKYDDRSMTLKLLKFSPEKSKIKFLDKLNRKDNKYPSRERFFKLTETGTVSIKDGHLSFNIIGKWKVVEIENKQPGWHVDITGSLYDFKTDQLLIITPADSLSNAIAYKYNVEGSIITVPTEDQNSIQYQYKLFEDGRLELDCATVKLILKPEN